MAFDPNLPTNNSPISSSELRNQFNGLKEHFEEQIDAHIAGLRSQLTDQLDESVSSTRNDLQSQLDGLRQESANSIGAIELLDVTLEDPPSAANLQQVIDKMNELITALKRS